MAKRPGIESEKSVKTPERPSFATARSDAGEPSAKPPCDEQRWLRFYDRALDQGAFPHLSKL